MTMRGCPATGRMFHNFDKATHRCRCGRWQAGYKPKVEPVRPRAECQICEGNWALDTAGCLGHHGYIRPGCGWIQGDCMGVGHAPYPATDALERYLLTVTRHCDHLEAALAEAPFLTQLPFTWVERDRAARKDIEHTTMIVKGAPSPQCGNYCVPSFESLLARRTVRLQLEIRYATEERRRVIARIAKAGS